MVYGDGLENRCPRKGTVGSNPTPSAILKLNQYKMPPNDNLKVGDIIVFANRLLTRCFNGNS